MSVTCKYEFVLPKGDARTAADTAALAEQAGWDGFFVWEPVWGVDRPATANLNGPREARAGGPRRRPSVPTAPA